ncbi:MAG: PadR family transcriptional regulator [Candidatus Aenigmatarchaeota archaeon]
MCKNGMYNSCCHGNNENICLKGGPIKGLLHLAILSLVKDKTIYGAEIYRALKEKFKIEVPKPIIYGLLRRMENFGFLVSKWDVEGGGPAKRMYKITEEGSGYLKESIENLKKIKNVIDNLLSENIEK